MLSRARWFRASGLSLGLASGLAAPCWAQSGAVAPSHAKPVPSPAVVSDVVVTASRVNLLGVAETASQGSVTKAEVELRPIYRIGQFYESVPGLVVTVHS